MVKSPQVLEFRFGHNYSGDCEGDFKLSKFPKKKRVPRRRSDQTIQSFFDSKGAKQNDERDSWRPCRASKEEEGHQEAEGGNLKVAGTKYSVRSLDEKNMTGSTRYRVALTTGQEVWYVENMYD